MTLGDREPNPVQDAADALAAELQADVLLYSGDLDPQGDHMVRGMCQARTKRPNLLILMVTWGGDADAAYRVARCLQRCYNKVTLFVPGFCKSAGTLLAVGAHEIVIGDDGELGPLDVQMHKEDSLWEKQSGLTVNAAMSALQARAYQAWEFFFLQTEYRSQGTITVKTAAKMATELTIGLFAPLYAQIDPLHVGEAARAMSVADHYGQRLMRASQNCSMETLQHLVAHYPSHTFAVDREEAEDIFKSVRAPTDGEKALAAALGAVAVVPAEHAPDRPPTVSFLCSELTQPSMSVEAAADPDGGDGITLPVRANGGDGVTTPAPPALGG